MQQPTLQVKICSLLNSPNLTRTLVNHRAHFLFYLFYLFYFIFIYFYNVSISTKMYLPTLIKS